MSQLILPAAFFARKPLVTKDGERLTAEDRFAMMELTHRYEWSYGALNKEALFGLLTDDVVIATGSATCEAKSR
jgi:hypothetical protein